MPKLRPSRRDGTGPNVIVDAISVSKTILYSRKRYHADKLLLSMRSCSYFLSLAIVISIIHGFQFNEVIRSKRSNLLKRDLSLMASNSSLSFRWFS